MFLFVPTTNAQEDSTFRHIRDFVFTGNSIWILTDENVIMRGREERHWHEIVKKDSWRTLFQIVDMCVTADDTILLLSSGAWGQEYRSNGEYIGIAGRGVSDNPSYEQRLARMPDGAIWLIRPEGVWILDNGYWKQNTSFQGAGLMDAATDSTGALWWIDWEYLNKYDVFTKKNTQMKFVGENDKKQYLPKSMAAAPDGKTVWCWATMDNIGYLLKIDSNYSWSIVSVPESLTSAAFTDIAVDDKNNVWVSTYGYGLFRRTGEKWEQFTVLNGLGANDVDIVTADQRGIFAGLSNASISIYDGSAWIQDSLDIVTGVDDDKARPAELGILGIYPNPFNSATTIRYRISKKGMVTVMVFSVAGQKVASLVNTGNNIGVHSVSWCPRGCSSGEYILVVTSGTEKTSRKVMFLK